MTAVLLDGVPVVPAQVVPLPLAPLGRPRLPAAQLPAAALFPAARRRYRERRRWQLLAIVAVLVAAGLLLVPRLVHHAAALTDVPAPAWGWLIASGTLSAGHFVTAAVALRAAAARPLPVRRTIAVQVSAAAANRLLPVGLGAAAVNVRYLERSGLPRAGAISVVAAGKVANGVVHVGATALALMLAGDAMLPVDPARLMRGWAAGAIASAVVAVLCAAVIVAARRPSVRARVGPHLVAARRQLVEIVRAPRSGVVLLAATAASKVVQIAALAAAVQAFGGGIAVTAIAVVYLAGSAIGGATPAPGGIGSLDAALLVGLTAAGGASGAMFAAVLAYRVLGFWLPVVPGALVLPGLHRRGAL